MPTNAVHVQTKSNSFHRIYAINNSFKIISRNIIFYLEYLMYMPKTATASWTMTPRIIMTANHTNTKSVAGTRYLNGSNCGPGLLTPLLYVLLLFSRLTCGSASSSGKDLDWWLGSRLGKAITSSQSSISSLAIFLICSNNEGWSYLYTFNLRQDKNHL